MSGPALREQVYSRDAEDLERRHIRNLRSMADRVENGGYFSGETREKYPDLTDEQRRAIVTHLRAKADKMEAHLDAIDNLFSNSFRDLVKAVEWCQTGDYGPDKIAKAWDEYDSVQSTE